MRKQILTSLFFLLFTSLTSQVNANSDYKNHERVYQRILLITSIDAPYEYLDRLEDNILDYFKHQEYILNAEHYATAPRIHQALTSGIFTGIIFVGHGSYFDNGFSPLGQSKVYDLESRDISDVFKNIHPNLKFLGIVSCYGNKFVKKLKQKNFIPENLVIESFDSLIDANIGVSKLVRKAYKVINKRDIVNGYHDTCKESKRFKIKFKSLELPQDKKQSPIMISTRNQLLGIISPDQYGQEKEFLIDVSKVKSKVDLKIIVSNGCNNCKNAQDNFPLGKYKISFSDENSDFGSWNLFSKSDGTPFGISQNIYQFNGNIGAFNTENYRPYFCPKFNRVKKVRRSKWSFK